MTHTYSLAYDAIGHSLEDAIRNLLEGDPLNISLELEEYEIDELSASQELIVDAWSIGDVVHLRPDLTHEQAWQVLKAAQSSYDSDQGISLHAIRAAASDLYGRPGTQ